MSGQAVSRHSDSGSESELPVWDLSDLYPGPESPELEADLERAADEARRLREEAEGRLASQSGDALAALIERYEAVQEILGRVMSYAQLVYAADVGDPATGRFQQAMQERTTTIASDTLFFPLELNRIDEEALERSIPGSALERWRPWLRDTRAFRPHQLSDEAEQLLHEKQVTGRNAWNRLFDDTMAELRFPCRGREMTSTEVLNELSSRDPERRKEAAASLSEVLGKNARTFALITNTLAKDKQIEDDWRHFERPVSSRNLANFVEDEVVDALVAAVREAYPRLSHRYYSLKARWMGKDKLEHWDRNAPPLSAERERRFSWGEARTTVLEAYSGLSPVMAEVAGRFFEEGWIDAPIRPGKAPGAFAHPTVPSAHPFVLLNYNGRTRDVMTLAHELGHGVHQVLAAGQGHLLSMTPLTLAETASVFGEMLTFRKLLAAETDPERRRILLAGKVEDMLNTVVRQIAFHEFERRVHDRRREGELSVEQLAEIWMATQSESLGPAFRLEEGYGVYWAYIPHFVHVPFYVYAYAFGDCLVNSLYAAYEGAPEGFAERYLEMLSAGGTRRHRELLAPFGLDASDQGFWRRGLDVIAGLIDELEALPAG